ncbi:MAG: helicase-associated domain-containing protein, partial [Anaerolineales bacterium]
GFIGFEPSEAASAPEAPPEPTPHPQPAYTPPGTSLPEPEYEDLNDFDAEPDAEEITPTPEDIAPVPLPRPAPARPAAPPPAHATPSASAAPGRAATPNERAHPIPASDAILDDATTLLAALRSGLPTPVTAIPADFLHAVLLAAGILRDSAPQPEAAKAFLEAPRLAALEQLSQAWQASDINDLRQTPGLICEGAWTNDPLVTREFLLDLLGNLPEGVWWSLPAFIRDIKSRYPDFQRPAGNFDAWLIRRQSDGESLRGFAHWDEVDGALIRYIITGPLHWLGEVDLAAPAENGPVTAFRLAKLPEKREEKGKISISSNGSIAIPRDAPRAVRYLAARFCAWEPEKAGAYRYRVTPASLQRAREQGLKVEHLLALLAKHSEGAVPPVFIKALNRWEAKGSEARIETLTVIRVASPEILNELRQKAARFLGEVIGPTTVTVRSGAAPKVLAILNEMGFLTEEQE